MNYSTCTKNVGLSSLLIFTFVLSDPGQACETKNPANLANLEAVQLDVRNNQITGIATNKTLKHVLDFLENN